jgi:nucleotide-binding universal stress UspA family protein
MKTDVNTRSLAKTRKNKTPPVRFRTILCPVDFFPASLRAFDYALKLASHDGARIHVLHVVAPFAKVGYETPPWVGDVMADLGKEAEHRVQKLKEKAAEARVPATTEVRAGGIDEEILQAVAKRRADLIVMGAHGRRGFQRWVLGSVTERMMRHSPVPLLVAGSAAKTANAPARIRRILVTTDFSAGTPDALTYAFSIARERGARMTLIHVVQDLFSEIGPEFTDQIVPKAREKLETLVPGDLRASTRIRVDVGMPYRVIRRIIETERPGLVVMNTHGKSMIERILVGSTADRVVRAASGKCAFLLIPPGRTRRRQKKGRA